MLKDEGQIPYGGGTESMSCRAATNAQEVYQPTKLDYG
jgi:hypothetical protein